MKKQEKYVYLGEANNKLMNLKDQLKSIEGKVEAAYQTIVAIAEDPNFKNIKMKCIWKLVKTCIIPIITYGCETWEPLKGEMKKLNQILDKIIKRILMTPGATPREALYIETGLLDIETIIDIKRLNMMARLNREKSKMMAAVLANPESAWMKQTRKTLEKYHINEYELRGTKAQSKFVINTGAYRKFQEKMTQAREDRSKLKFFLDGKTPWKPVTPAEYMEKLTRKQASTIFKARTRMVKVKGNYKNGYHDLSCRACKHPCETQTHVLQECKALHPGANRPTNDLEMPLSESNMRLGTRTNDNNTLDQNENLTDDNNNAQPMDMDRPDTDSDTDPDIGPEKLFSEDTDILKEISKFIDDTMDGLMLCDE